MSDEKPVVIPQMSRLTRPGSKFVLNLISRYTMRGLEYYPKPPFIIMSNHLSYLDSLVAGSLSLYNIPVMAAKKYRGKIVGKLIEYFFAPIWLEQEAPDRQALKTGLAILETGSALGIAPEGTRSKTGVLQQGMDGAAFLVRKANVPILPCAIYGTEKIFTTLRPAVYGVLGRPFHLPEVAKVTKEVLKQDTDRIMCSLAALMPPEYHGYYAGNPLIEEMAQLVRP